MGTKTTFNESALDTEAIGGVIPWSASRSAEPVVLPEELAAKNQTALNPLASPRVYEQFYDQKAGQLTVSDPVTGQDSVYALKANVNDVESSFHAKVVVNPETQHAVIMFKGMDKPFFDEGSGMGGSLDDIAAQSDSVAGNISDQVLAAEKLYLETLNDPSIQSVEIVGYSIGSIPANYLSTVYGAKSTVFANLGVPDVDSFHNAWGLLDFNEENDFPSIEGAFEENINANVTSIVISYDDAMGGVIGDVGREYGTEIQLDNWYDFNAQGLLHVPGVYAGIAEQIPETPSVTLDVVSDKPQFKEFENQPVVKPETLDH